MTIVCVDRCFLLGGSSRRVCSKSLTQIDFRNFTLHPISVVPSKPRVKLTPYNLNLLGSVKKAKQKK